MKKILVTLLAVAIGLGMITAVTAEDPVTNAEETSEVEVEIADETRLDVRPSELDFGTLDPGDFEDVASGLGDYSDQDFDKVEIENQGSNYIDQVWAETSVPTERPFAQDDDSVLNTGNFIKISPENQDEPVNSINSAIEETSANFFVNRREFMEPNSPSYLNLGTPDSDWDTSTGVTLNQDNVLQGRFRVGEEEYFWAIPVDGDASGQSTGECTDDNILRVGEEPHDQAGLGTVDFAVDDTEAEDIEDYEIGSTADTNTGVATGVSVGDNDYDVLTVCNDEASDSIDFTNSYTELVSYNVDPEGSEGTPTNIGDDGEASYILQTTTEDEMLWPGQGMQLPISMELPFGIPQGDIQDGDLRILATSQAVD